MTLETILSSLLRTVTLLKSVFNPKSGKEVRRRLLQQRVRTSVRGRHGVHWSPRHRCQHHHRDQSTDLTLCRHLANETGTTAPGSICRTPTPSVSIYWENRHQSNWVKSGTFFFCFYSPCSSSNKQLRALAWGSMPNLPFSFSWPLVRNNVVLDPAKCHLNPSNGESMIINDRQTTDRPHYAKMCNNNPWRCKKPYLMVWFKVKL